MIRQNTWSPTPFDHRTGRLDSPLHVFEDRANRRHRAPMSFSLAIPLSKDRLHMCAANGVEAQRPRRLAELKASLDTTGSF